MCFKTKKLNLSNFLDLEKKTNRKKEKGHLFNITCRCYTADHTACLWNQNGYPDPVIEADSYPVAIYVFSATHTQSTLAGYKKLANQKQWNTLNEYYYVICFN